MDQTTFPSKINEMVSSLLNPLTGPEVLRKMRIEFKDRLALLGGESGTFLLARFSERMETSEELRQVMAALLKKFAPEGNNSLYFDFYLKCFYRDVISFLMAEASRNLLQAVTNLNEKPSIHHPSLNYGMTEREVLASLRKLLESDSSSLQTLFSRVQDGDEVDIKTVYKDDLIALKMTHCINRFEERLDLKKTFTSPETRNSWVRFLLIVYHCIGTDECFPRDSKKDGANWVWKTAFFCDQDDEKELFIQVLLKSECDIYGGFHQLVALFHPLVRSLRHQRPHQIRKLLKEGLTSSLDLLDKAGFPSYLTLSPPLASNDQDAQSEGKENVEEDYRKLRSLELRKLFEKLVQEQVDDKAAARSCGV